ncbi:uncharacterized protein I206_103622 [Kwoniella pini CBS 10737]|uniref:Uncharacterized protein n=1 Tax=Kwoniella pini CBS 10737 TaxID=1296096 RepID=A0A1B9I987_9TREE|nr:uncharacterized protein I206_01375 [Kwoniella pini CBS 10737]OCF52090.1 hypothetical protein I206_01375 [Kwoniella pini CBS 10737]
MTAYLSPHSHHHHQLRTCSNKENTPSASSSSVFGLTDIDAISTSLQTSLSGVTPASSSSRPKKANGLGIGRAPKFIYRKHSSKPYNRERVSSIQRAKKNANRLPSSSSKCQKPKKGVKPRPTPLKLRDRILEREEETRKMKVIDRVRLDRWRKSVWRPCSTILSEGLDLRFKLERPPIPPILSVNDRYCGEIPIDYILSRLTPMLPSISTITLAYRPYSTVPHPDPTIPKGSTLPLGIPEIIHGNKSHWAERTKLREPDMVLAVYQRGAEGETGKMLIPVLSTVFASQCAFWPNLTHQIAPPSKSCSLPQPSSSSSSASSSANTGYNRRTKSEAAVSQALPAIIESSEDGSGAENDTETDDTDSSNTSWSSVSTSNDEAHPSGLPIPTPVKDHYGFLHLPIVPFPIPSKDTFDIIHRLLHHPHRSIIPDLLNLPDEKCKNLESITRELRELPVQQLMERVQNIHGVWQNICCLGIGNLGTWKQLCEAWSCALGIITGHAILNKNIPPQQIDLTKKTPRSLTERIAWEWVRDERARMEFESM